MAWYLAGLEEREVDEVLSLNYHGDSFGSQLLAQCGVRILDFSNTSRAPVPLF